MTFYFRGFRMHQQQRVLPIPFVFFVFCFLFFCFLDRMGVLRLLLLSVVCLSFVVVSEATRREEYGIRACTMQSSSSIQNPNGQTISMDGYDDSNWYGVEIPATVMAGLIQNDVYPDIFYSTNLENVNSSLFDVSWWYRCALPEVDTQEMQAFLLQLDGINYRGNVWMNGHLLGNQSDIVGTFRTFSFDVSNIWKESGSFIALEISRPYDNWQASSTDTDLAISFLDWAPDPPDSNMGVWKKISLFASPFPTSSHSPSVSSFVKMTEGGGNEVKMNISIGVKNWGGKAVRGVVRVESEGVFVGVLEQDVELGASSDTLITFTSSSFPSLQLTNASLWYPWQMGSPTLHPLNYSFTPEGFESGDNGFVRYGIREVTSTLTSQGYRLFQINGNPILIRGAGWAPDLFLRSSEERIRDEFRLVRHMGLNTVRYEGKFDAEYMYRIADEMGVLMMVGWSCCDAWQRWSLWGDEQMYIAQESMRSTAQFLRSHPSVFVFLYGSDESPPQNVEQMYLNVLEEELWPNPSLASAADTNSSITGSTGVKMSGPYSWEPPNYWLTDPGSWGGAWGFLTEGGPGENPLTFDSFNATVPPQDDWPIDSVWDYHCGNPNGLFDNLRFFTPPLDARYGSSSSAQEYLMKSQAATYESHRALFEGYSQRKYESTGVIQWMLNNAWPEMIWHLYDYYLNTGGSYYGSKKALEPLHVQYSYSDNSIWGINSLYKDAMVSVEATVYSMDGKVLWKDKSVRVLVGDSSSQLMMIPEISYPSVTYFVSLVYQFSFDEEMENSAFYPFSHPPSKAQNVYWLSTEKDVLDWENSNFYRTPCTQFADVTELQKIPPSDNVEVVCSLNITDKIFVSCEIANPSPILFLLRLSLVKKDHNNNNQFIDQEVLPFVWSDNYITLFEGERGSLVGEGKKVEGEFEVVWNAWNTPWQKAKMN